MSVLSMARNPGQSAADVRAHNVFSLTNIGRKRVELIFKANSLAIKYIL